MITVEQMKPKLLSVEHVRQVLGQAEPLVPHRFEVGPRIAFTAEPGWNAGIAAKDGGEPIGVFAHTDIAQVQLTRSCLDEVCAAFGFKRGYADGLPANLLVSHMNWWFREGLQAQPRKKQLFQFFVNDRTAIAFARQSLLPFSGLALLDRALEGIHAKYGPVEVLADYKFTHTLRRTHVRLIVPNAYRVLTGTGTPDDVWSVGISLRNSLIGASQTALEGYLFRWTCTNGQIDARLSHAWTRRPTATEKEVYDWARQAVDEALSGLDGALDAVAGLTQLGIDGPVSETLRDVFEHYHVPIHQRSRVIAILEEYEGEITMYVIMNAITQAANEAGLEPTTVEGLMRIGGDLPYTANQRCGTCRRLMHSH